MSRTEIAFFLHDLAAELHSLWNKGKDSPQLRFVNQTDRNSTLARLSLVRAIKTVLASGLESLGSQARRRCAEAIRVPASG